jgi:recombinational DNA repair protein RecT
MSKTNELIQLKVEELNQLTPSQVLEYPKVEQKFIIMYNGIHGTDRGELIYNKEKANYQKLITENKDLKECTPISIYLSFLDIAINGLSLDNTGGRTHCYLIPRKTKTGRKDEKGYDIHEKRVTVSVTGYGELTMRMRAGQIKYADNPVVVFEGDTFVPELDANGAKRITYKAMVPRPASAKVVGAFIRIIRMDGSVDYQWLLEGDIARLSHYSAKNNSYWKDGQRVMGNANELFSSFNGSIDPGFLEAKMIKHAFDAYPKVMTGRNTVFEADIKDEPVIDYGIEEVEAEDVTEKPTAFGEDLEPETPPAVTYTEDNDEGF